MEKRFYIVIRQDRRPEVKDFQITGVYHTTLKAALDRLKADASKLTSQEVLLAPVPEHLRQRTPTLLAWTEGLIHDESGVQTYFELHEFPPSDVRIW